MGDFHIWPMSFEGAVRKFRDLAASVAPQTLDAIIDAATQLNSLTVRQLTALLGRASRVESTGEER